MQFIKPDININFIARRYIAFAVSAAMILMTIISLVAHHGPKYGIDFAGGTLIQIKFDTPTQIADIKELCVNLRGCIYKNRRGSAISNRQQGRNSPC